MKKFLFSSDGWPYLLSPFIVAAIVLEFADASATVIFAIAAIALIPAAAVMGRATEELAARSGPGIGGLLNVTFGNFPELIIAILALEKGLQEVVKASLVGSIIGNILLVMGASMLVGGLKRKEQIFNQTAASVQSSMLVLAMAALIMPAVYEMVDGTGLPRPGLGDRQLRLVGREALRDRLRLPAGQLRRRTDLLAGHAQDLFNQGHDEEMAAARLAGQALDRRARRCERRGRSDERDPRRLDRRGLECDRPL